tara:strand:+ start:2048 stop:3001 length:954 start_codon:yes stop_codon:yes gene_type:complete
MQYKQFLTQPINSVSRLYYLLSVYAHHSKINALAIGFLTGCILASPFYFLSTPALGYYSVTALMPTILVGCYSSISAMLFCNDKPSLLASIIEGGHNSCLKLAIKLGWSLSETIENNKFDLPSNFRGYAPLHVAVVTGNKEAAKLIIKGGANINQLTNRDTILGIQTKRIRRVISRRSHTYPDYVIIHTPIYGETKEYSALHLACKKGNVDMIQLLLKCHVNITQLDHLKRVPKSLLSEKCVNILREKSKLEHSLLTLTALAINASDEIKVTPENTVYDMQVFLYEVKKKEPLNRFLNDGKIAFKNNSASNQSTLRL